MKNAIPSTFHRHHKPMNRAAPLPMRSAWTQGRGAADRGDWPQARHWFRQATKDAPSDVLMWLNLAQACLRLDDCSGAAESLAKVLELEPTHSLGRKMASEVFGRWLLGSDNLVRDLRLLPAHLMKDAVFLTHMAHTVWSAGKPSEASTMALHALAAKPVHVPAYEMLVCCMRDMGLKAEASECARTVIALAPSHLSAKIHLLFDQRGACDWIGMSQMLEEVKADIDRMGRHEARHLAVFGLLSMGLDPLLQRKAAEIASRWTSPQAGSSVPASPKPRKPGPMRIGFISADFRFHPVAQLITDFIERMDRGRCEVNLYALGLPDDSDWRRRLVRAADVFADLGQESDGAIAHRIRTDGVDVLIELGGHTRGARLGVLAHRPAPVQATYLGYPGTTGHEQIDYLIGDRVVTPLGAAEQYSEKIAQLSGCLIPGSLHRPPVVPVSRASLGLPDEAFVMCALNQPYKLLPETFDIWCEVLREVPRAVLWLSAPNEEVELNLRQEAARRGVDPGQLVFAERTSYEDYFNRFSAADLFVDTWPYGAHTTASDALWAGLPLLTMEGSGFASRVGASLLRSIGLEGLVCPDVQAYRNHLLALARDPSGLKTIRTRLKSQRHQLTIFDPQRFADDFLEVVEAMHQRHLRGLPPDYLAAERAAPDYLAAERAAPDLAGGTGPGPMVQTLETQAPEAVDRLLASHTERLRLHLGGKEAKPGWKIVNIQPGPGVDLLGDVRDMSHFSDQSVDEIYASHVLEHIGQQAMLPTLQGLHRILKPGGELRISVPDIEVLSRVVADASAAMDKRYLAMRMMFGGQVDEHDYHYFGWTWDFMRLFLGQAGFSRLQRVQDFGLFRDASSLKPWGFPISLNVVAIK